MTTGDDSYCTCNADVLLELANPTTPAGDTDTTPKETK